MRWLPFSLRTCAARAVHSASTVVSKRERSVALFPRSFDWFTGGEPLVKGPAVAGGAAAAISGCFSRSLQGWRARRRSRGDSPKLALLFGDLESIGGLRRLGRWEPEYLDLAFEFEVQFNRQKPSSWAALVGARVGASGHSHHAMLGDVQPAKSQVGAALDDVELRQATGWS